MVMLMAVLDSQWLVLIVVMTVAQGIAVAVGLIRNRNIVRDRHHLGSALRRRDGSKASYQFLSALSSGSA